MIRKDGTLTGQGGWRLMRKGRDGIGEIYTQGAIRSRASAGLPGGALLLHMGHALSSGVGIIGVGTSAPLQRTRFSLGVKGSLRRRRPSFLTPSGEGPTRTGCSGNTNKMLAWGSYSPYLFTATMLVSPAVAQSVRCWSISYRKPLSPWAR